MSNDLPMSNDDLSLDELARRAAEGDRETLSTLIRELQHPMYRLALRFLGHPDDAQDACQEILVRIVTHLSGFEGRSKFTTWAYTVAVRSLLRTRRRLVESSVQGAERFAALLHVGMGEVDPTLEEVEYRLLCEEVRISCTYGMLLCLSRPQRDAYLLADVLGLPDREGAELLGCTREAFRQRVSRARRTLRQVIDNRRGLVDPANPCRCGRQIASRPGRRHPGPRSAATRSPCPPGGAGVGRTGRQAARCCCCHWGAVPLRPLRRPPWWLGRRRDGLQVQAGRRVTRRALGSVGVSWGPPRAVRPRP
jgi:RNA polymerase sigma factor (sigma-70 family)